MRSGNIPSAVSLILAVSLNLGFASTDLPAQDPPTAQALLRKYEASVQKLSRVRLQFELTRRYPKLQNEARRTQYRVCRDGPRWGIRRVNHVPGGELRGEVRDFCEVLLDREFVQIVQSAGEEAQVVAWLDGESAAPQRWTYLQEGALFFGWFPENGLAPFLMKLPESRESYLWRAILPEESLDVDSKPEQLDGVSTWHVCRRGKQGQLSLWLDPAAGALPRQIVHIEVRPPGEQADDAREKPAQGNRDRQGRVNALPAKRQLKRIMQRIDKIQIEHIDGVPVMTSFDYLCQTTYHDGTDHEIETSARAYAIDFKDEVEIENGFSPSLSIPDGTSVTVVQQPGITREMQLNTEWRDGKIHRKK